MVKKQQPKKKKIVERLVAERNVERRKKEGWKIIEKRNELTLMSKEI